MILMALILAPIIGAMSLVADIGNFFYIWHKLQAGTDAATIAGASYLPAYPDVAKTVAQAYALNNNIAATEVESLEVSGDKLSLTMVTSRSAAYVFGKVLGLKNAVLRTTATARAQSVGKGNGAAPLGIDYQTSYTFGQTVTIKAGQVGAGNWSPLSLGGTGASNYLYNVENGYAGTLAAGDTPQTEPGNVVGPTKTGVDYRISKAQAEYPSGTFSDHALADPRVMLVPMVDFSKINGRSEVPVKGFAELWIVSVDENDGSITTYFIEQTAPSTQALPGIDSFGAFTPVLSK